ncbi:hypothetical protein [Rhodococcus sp. A5(2022)]|uniref:hypothetical protein n=1 Tax=Rhodococcus sp. A5(2022) TaxID=3003588 RepID=UPI0022A841D2|nr:hypothetical protein [Rhodococcus sp. A5(2022)]MCZ1075074.1 hypothetical protein [Rhodococcus sp. A5(2022)]
MPSSPPPFTDEALADLDARAVRLVAITHGDGDAGDVAQLTARLDRQQLIGLAISCAAMVDPAQPMSRLLAWMDPNSPAEQSSGGEAVSA